MSATTNDLITGPMKDTDIGANQKPKFILREVKEYKGDLPSNDGKVPIKFPTKEKCDVQMGKDRENKDRGRCKQPLQAVRIKNTKYQPDEYGFGGQLNYDESDQKTYLQCPIHGPFPSGPAKW